MSQTNDVKQIHIQSRVDSEQNWINNNPELLDREIGYTLDGKYKIGKALEDGTLLRWNELEYVNFGTTNLENGEGENSLQQKGNVASGQYAFAEGINTTAIGQASHAEGSSYSSSSETCYFTGAAKSKLYVYTKSGPVTDDIEGSEPWKSWIKQVGSIVSYTDNNNNSIAAIIVKEYYNEDTKQQIFELDRTLNSTEDLNEAIVTITAPRGYAYGENAHIENDSNTAYRNAHAEGKMTRAIGDQSHSEGLKTIATTNEQHVQGRLNLIDTENKYAHIVGNGQERNDVNPLEIINRRSNAHTLDWDGNAWFAGDVYIGGTGQDSADAFRVKDKIDGLQMVLDTKAYKYHAIIPRAETDMWISHTADIDNTMYHTWTCDYYFEEVGADTWLNTLPISNDALFTIDHEYIDGRTFSDYKTEETQYIDYILGGISKIEDNKLTITIFGEIPTVDIPIVIKEI